MFYFSKNALKLTYGNVKVNKFSGGTPLRGGGEREEGEFIPPPGNPGSATVHKCALVLSKLEVKTSDNNRLSPPLPNKLYLIF